MSASTYEYKTVALPQMVQAKRRRGVSEADLVAATFGEVIHLEAVDGWEYMRADTLAAGTRGGMFSKEPRVTHYSVLVFRRIQEDAWPVGQAGMAPEPTEAAVPSPEPSPKPAPAAPKPAPPMIDDPTSPLSRGGVLTTGGQFNADGTGVIASTPRPAPRPPLGSAQD